MVNIAVFVSGGGTNLQALIDALDKEERPLGKVALVVASNENAFALKRAEKHGIPSAVISRKCFDDVAGFDRAILNICKEYEIGLIVLAGYLSKIGADLLSVYENRIINIHPSLIPSFCGKGYYGIIPHQKALEYGVKVTGATVHFIDPDYDSGPVIMQKAVAIKEDDSAETLQKRVMEEAEQVILPEAVKLFCQGKLKVNGRKVRVLL